ncbi:MAG: energy transducer TonB [Leptolyngbyaceae cyanobacterium CSU_1_3]|nr:energy transducer TonB [Leptolyngbyaceae cyanobacterium CSU_1_3]
MERNKPKCKDNCSLDEYLGAEGSARFDFDVDKDGNPINIRLRTTSGDAEIDRKAEEAIRRRRYEASETGFQGQRIRVTSEREGSEFQRQSRDRRQQEAAQQAERESQRAAQEQQERERLQREAEQERPPASAVEPARPPEAVPPIETIPPNSEPAAPVEPAPEPEPAPIEPAPESVPSSEPPASGQ